MWFWTISVSFSTLQRNTTLVNQINISRPHLGLGNYDITPWVIFVSKKALKPTMTQTSALHQNALKVQKLSLIFCSLHNFESQTVSWTKKLYIITCLCIKFGPWKEARKAQVSISREKEISLNTYVYLCINLCLSLRLYKHNVLRSMA